MNNGQVRKALVVGINEYEKNPLRCCENDASEIDRLLHAHGPKKNGKRGAPNFKTQLILSSKASASKQVIEKKIKDLFNGEEDMAAFYFSGHGSTDHSGGYIIPQDAKSKTDGIPMQWILELANQSQIKEILIILDCCHAGAIGGQGILNTPFEMAQVRKGVSILASTTSSDVARERMGHGVFTRLLIQGLEGAAADLFGHVSAHGLYSFAEAALSPWEQRPVLKSFVQMVQPIRFCRPKVSKEILRDLPDHFSSKDSSFSLSPEFEETSSSPNKEHVALFKEFKRMEIAGILECVGEESLYWEAMRNGGCRLTPYGKYIWHLAEKEMI